MEGPSVKVVAEKLKKIISKRKILDVAGNTKKFNIKQLKGLKILDVDSYGKNLLIYLDNGEILRVHFLMYGSYSINKKKKEDKHIRLSLIFENSILYFYNCSVSIVREIKREFMDILDKNWDYRPVLRYLRNSNNLICDDLLDQIILPGVGNIIKVESLFRSKVHPESISKNIPEERLIELLKNVRNFSLKFYKIRKRGQKLKRILLCYGKTQCYYCGSRLKIKKLGKRNRINFYCENCQIKY